MCVLLRICVVLKATTHKFIHIFSDLNGMWVEHSFMEILFYNID